MDTDKAVAVGFLLGAGLVGGWITVAWLSSLEGDLLPLAVMIALAATAISVIGLLGWLLDW